MKPLETKEIFHNRIFPICCLNPDMNFEHVATATLIMTPKKKLFLVTARHVFDKENNISKYSIYFDGMYFPLEKAFHSKNFDISICSLPAALALLELNSFLLMNYLDMKEFEKIKNNNELSVETDDGYDHIVVACGYPECETYNGQGLAKSFHGVEIIGSESVYSLTKQLSKEINPDYTSNIITKFNYKRSMHDMNSNKFSLQKLNGISGGALLKKFYFVSDNVRNVVEMEFCGITTDYICGHIVGINKSKIYGVVLECNLETFE